MPTASNKGKPIPKGCWFDKIHIDYGKCIEQTKKIVTDYYRFENRTGKAQQITSIETSCKCQQMDFMLEGKKIALERKTDRSLKAPIVIPAGAKGAIKMNFDVTGGPGPRTGDVRIETTDPAMPNIVLTAEATVTAAYRVTPSIVQLGQMDPSEKRDWEVKVECMVRKDWKILRADKVMPQGMQVTSIERSVERVVPEKPKGPDGTGGAAAPAGDKAENGNGAHAGSDEGETQVVYTIKGSYGPNLPQGAFGGYLLFHTDSEQHKVQLQIAAEVKERVMITPRFFSMRSFPRSSPPTKTVYLWGADGKELEIESMKLLKLRNVAEKDVVLTLHAPDKESKEMLELQHITDKIAENRVWRVTLTMKPGFKSERRGAVRGEVEIRVKGLSVPVSFSFNGFPRGR